MGRRGPAPTPTKLRLLRGNPGRRPINNAEPKPAIGRPPCPRWLLPEAKAEWRRVVPHLERLGLLTAIDRAALAAYCQSWARYVDAESKLSQYGEILKATASGYVQQSPYVNISHKSLIAVRAFCQEFGLTPSSRTRIETPSAEGSEDDFDEYLNRGKK